MMGRDSGRQEKLFITNFTLESRVRKGHVLRKVAATIDFDFIYDEVKDTYGENGNVSVPPAVILKMLLLLVMYNVRSERELMATIPERLDWLWFLGYDLESEVPHHSVLSKARARWGVTAFKHFFERIVWQCVEAGLVDGKKLFVDASLIDADASNDSVVDTKSLKERLKKGYKHLEKRLDEIQDKKPTPADSRYISGTDPDASVIRRGPGKSKLRYKTHRGVDPANEVITATEVTPGAVDDAHMLQELLKKHEENTRQEVETLVADSKYGTMDNYLDCHDRDIKTRQHLSERSFAQSTRYGYKRARWRGLWRMQIQDYLIAAVQNIITLTTRSPRKLSKSNAMKARPWGAAPRLRRFMEPPRKILTRFVGHMRQSFACI